MDVAPITLITGQPGQGKTALALEILLKEQGKRPIFVGGIPDLKLEYEPVPPLDKWTEERIDEDTGLSMHYFVFPQGALIVLDECQRWFRPRPASSKVPPYIAAFETVRHTGVEFVILTQGIQLLDSHIRPLVGRHMAISTRLLGRYVWEWPYVGDVTSKTSREEASKRRYKPNPKVFGLYKSAVAHIAAKRRVHQIWLYLGLALLVLGVFSWRAYGVATRQISQAAPAPRPGAVLGQPHSPPQAASSSSFAPPADWVDALTPRHAYDPSSAPAYDALRTQIVTMPKISLCVSSHARCHCYSDQGTRLQGVPDQVCRDAAEHGRFDPYSKG